MEALHVDVDEADGVASSTQVAIEEGKPDEVPVVRGGCS